MSLLLQDTRWKYLWIIAVLISFFTLSPTLENKWVNWDDQAYVLENPLVKTLDVSAIFSTLNVVGNYHPITVLSLAIDHSIGELDPFSYHAHNLLLHLLNTILVFFFIAKTFKSYPSAFIVSLLFGIHPLHVESVAWVSARKDLLFTFYLLLALLCYLRFSARAENKNRYYLCCLLFFALSLLSKGMAVVFPVYLLLLDFLQERRFKASTFIEKIPFFVMSIVFTIVTLTAQQAEGAIVGNEQFPILERLSISSISTCIYFIKVLIPYQLSPFHPYPFQELSQVPFHYYLSLISIPFTLVIIYKAWQKQNRLVIFGLVFFISSLLPVLQFVVHGRAMMAERYTYVAYLGLFIILAHYLLLGIKRLKNQRIQNATLIVILLCMSLLMGGRSYVESKVWKNGEKLWTSVIESYPKDYFGYSSRAEYFFTTNQLQPALKDVNKSIELYPNFTGAYNLRGRIWDKTGQDELAVQDFSKAITLAPEFKPPYVNIAQAHARKKQYALAKNYLDQVIVLDPTYAKAFLNRGVINEKLNEFDAAINDYTHAIKLVPQQGIYHRYRAVLYLSQQQLDLAIIDFNNATRHNPNDGLSYFLCAKAYYEKGQFDQAKSKVFKAQQLNYQVPPDFLKELLQRSK